MTEAQYKAMVEMQKCLIEDYKNMATKTSNVMNFFERLTKQREVRQKRLQQVVDEHDEIAKKAEPTFKQTNEINDIAMTTINQQQKLKVELTSKIYVQNSVNRSLQHIGETLDTGKNRLQQELEVTKKINTDINLIQQQQNAIEARVKLLNTSLTKSGTEFRNQATTVTTFVKADLVNKVVTALEKVKKR